MFCLAFRVWCWRQGAGAGARIPLVISVGVCCPVVKLMKINSTVKEGRMLRSCSHVCIWRMYTVTTLFVKVFLKHLICLFDFPYHDLPNSITLAGYKIAPCLIVCIVVRCSFRLEGFVVGGSAFFRFSSNISPSNTPELAAELTAISISSNVHSRRDWCCFCCAH